MTWLLLVATVVAGLVLLLGRLLHDAGRALLDMEEPWRHRWEDGTPRVKVTLPRRTLAEEWRRL